VGSLFLSAFIAAQDKPPGASLSDVHAAMQQAEHGLKAGDTSATTQSQQQTAIEMLTLLIEAAKAREASSQSSSGGGQSPQKSQSSQSLSQSQSQTQPGDTAGSGNQPSEPPAAERTERRGPQSPWSKLRDKKRDPVYSAIKERFPARYQQLLEQYYKSFQDGPRQ
jgi:hypothetical protein